MILLIWLLLLPKLVMVVLMLGVIRRLYAGKTLLFVCRAMRLAILVCLLRGGVGQVVGDMIACDAAMSPHDVCNSRSCLECVEMVLSVGGRMEGGFIC